MKKIILFLSLAIAGNLLVAQSFDHFSELKKYNVAWDSPSASSLGSMPVGNGDIGLNVWVEENGDLQFYLSKTDAWSENGQLLKLGRIRIKLTPNPFEKGKSFRQELDLSGGEIRINAGKPDNQVEVVIRVDANHPLAEVMIQSNKPVHAEVISEPWRTAPRMMDDPDELPAVYGLHGSREEPVIVDPDSILPATRNRISWFHRNTRSIWADNLRLQALGDLTNTMADPLLNRIFGAAIEGTGMQAESPVKLRTVKDLRKITISIYPLTANDLSPVEWQVALDSQIAQVGKIKTTGRIAAHRKWWTGFWSRSYIFVTPATPDAAGEAETVTRGYILQRYINACGGRGASPIKFNGSIFTVDTYDRGIRKGFDADFRLWGGPYWFQNTRLPYWTMLESGDFDLMKPLFKMYFDALPLRKAATKKYYNHEGAFFPETMYFWGTYTDANYGRHRQGMPDGLTENTYIRYYWTCGLEIAQLMIDYYLFTEDEAFARDTLVPFTREVLLFFDKHWHRDIEGKILFTPAQSLETYQTAVDPTPDIAGLIRITSQFLELSGTLVDPELRTRIYQLSRAIPDIPMREINGEKVIAPARHSAQLANIENPELYTIFPFGIYGVNKPDLDLAIRTFHNRKFTFNIGWQQSSIQAACLGLKEEAAALVLDKFAHSDPECRFPAFWGPNYDWSPDQDHGTVAMIALQRMLLQYDGDKVFTLPAWPRKWNVAFKLCAPGGKTVAGSYRDGAAKIDQ